VHRLVRENQSDVCELLSHKSAKVPVAKSAYSLIGKRYPGESRDFSVKENDEEIRGCIRVLEPSLFGFVQ
jgi:hypothetical protein